jgi:hypothetical protein
LQRAGDALHAGADRQHVLGADGTVGVAEALEGIAFERRLWRRNRGCEFELVEFRRRRHANSRLVHPFAGLDRLRGVSDDFVVAADRGAFRNVGKRDLVTLRHEIAQLKATGKAGFRGQPEIIDHDRDVVVGVEPDVARLVGLRRRMYRHDTLLVLRARPARCLLPSPDRYRPFSRWCRIRGRRRLVRARHSSIPCGRRRARDSRRPRSAG